jgi:hypothetical protein
MRRFFAAMIVMLTALPAAAQPPYYARGTFGAVTPNPIDPINNPPSEFNDLSFQMVDQGGGHYTRTVGDSATYFPNTPFDYKLANLDYSTSAPGDNGHIVTDNNGEMNFHLWTNNGNPWTDGWYPNNGPRAGYKDPQQFGWEVVGSFNSWPAAADPLYALTADVGQPGLYTGTFTFPTTGSYLFKFRQQGSWGTSIGKTFSNTAENIPFRVWDSGDQWTFKLDLPTGRWQATSANPTPDLNGDDYVDAHDYVLWRKSAGSQAQYNEWRKHFGEGPPPATPSTFYARGGFNGYDQSIPMTDQGGGLYEVTVNSTNAPNAVPAIAPGARYSYKLANSDYSQDAPQGSFKDGKVAVDDNGEIHFHLFNQTNWTDGWNPKTERRAGYDDPHQFGWEVIGNFTGSGFATLGVMTDKGGGLYSLVAPLSAGTFPFKFRMNTDGTPTGGLWDISIGANFANNAADASTGLLTAGSYKFELDLRNGRWRVGPASSSGLASGAVPEPASVAIAMMALVFTGMVRRRGQANDGQ